MRMSTPLRLCSRAPVSVSHRGPTRRRVVGHRDLALAGEILPGERALATRDIGPANTSSPPFSPLCGPELHHVVRRADRLEVVLDDEHRVAAVAQPEEQPEQPVHVARVQADRRLVEHVERVDELRAERVGEPDALRLAAGERARRAIQREVVEPDVAQEAHAVARFLEDVRRDLLLESARAASSSSHSASAPTGSSLTSRDVAAGDLAPGAPPGWSLVP